MADSNTNSTHCSHDDLPVVLHVEQLTIRCIDPESFIPKILALEPTIVAPDILSSKIHHLRSRDAVRPCSSFNPTFDLESVTQPSSRARIQIRAKEQDVKQGEIVDPEVQPVLAHSRVQTLVASATDPNSRHFEHTPELMFRRLGSESQQQTPLSLFVDESDTTSRLQTIQHLLAGQGSPSVIIRDGNVELIDKGSRRHKKRRMQRDAYGMDISDNIDPLSTPSLTPSNIVPSVYNLDDETPILTKRRLDKERNDNDNDSCDNDSNNMSIMIVCDSVLVDHRQSGTVFRIESTSLNSDILITLPNPLIRPGMKFTFVLSKPRLGQVVSIVSEGINAYPFEWSTMIDGNPMTYSLQPRIVNAFNKKEPNTFHTTPFTLISGRDIGGRGIWFSDGLTFGWLPMIDYTKQYQLIKEQIQDLDLIVFRGNAFTSRVITTMERWASGKGDWSHVGVVISKRLLPDLNTDDPPDSLYIWESTLSTQINNPEIQKPPRSGVCVESNTAVFGVQIRRLDDVLRRCFLKNVKVGWCKLLVNPQMKRLDETDDMYTIRLHNMKIMLKNLHQEYYHRPYEKNLFRVFSSLSSSLNCCRSDCCPGGSWVFCSQLVGIIYQQLGLIDKQIDPATITPQLLVSPETSKTVHLMRVVATPVILMET